MKKSLSVVGTAVAFLFAFALSFNALISNAWASDGFSQNCKDISIRGSTLSASCEKANGGYQNTSIDLNSYIGNINGELVWNYQNFIETCDDIEVYGGTLEGWCLTRDQEPVAAAINLDEHIANVDGRLQYE